MMGLHGKVTWISPVMGDIRLICHTTLHGLTVSYNITYTSADFSYNLVLPANFTIVNHIHLCFEHPVLLALTTGGINSPMPLSSAQRFSSGFYVPYVPL